MICKKCGCNIPDDSEKCPLCGAEIHDGTTVGDKYEYVKLSELDEAPQKELPMRWYKFLLYISLPLTVINNIVSAFSALFTPVNKGAAIINDISVELVKRINVFYGIALIFMAAVAIFAWGNLYKFKKNALFSLVTLYILDLIFSMVYLGLTLYAEKIPFSTDVALSFGSAVFVSLVMIIANTIYFKKRSNLFKN